MKNRNSLGAEFEDGIRSRIINVDGDNEEIKKKNNLPASSDS